jgi:hypothetical protein
VEASAVVVVVVPAAFSASLPSAHTADTPEPYPPESGSAPALMGEEEELASVKKQSRRPKKSAPQKKENPWSALAPQYPVEIAGL